MLVVDNLLKNVTKPAKETVRHLRDDLEHAVEAVQETVQRVSEDTLEEVGKGTGRPGGGAGKGRCRRGLLPGNDRHPEREHPARKTCRTSLPKSRKSALSFSISPHDGGRGCYR